MEEVPSTEEEGGGDGRFGVRVFFVNESPAEEERRKTWEGRINRARSPRESAKTIDCPYSKSLHKHTHAQAQARGGRQDGDEKKSYCDAGEERERETGEGERRWVRMHYEHSEREPQPRSREELVSSHGHFMPVGARPFLAPHTHIHRHTHT